MLCPSCGRLLARTEYADFWHRLGGYVVDYILLGIVGFVVAFVLSLIVLSTAPDVAYTQEQVDEQDRAEATATVVSSIVIVAIGLGYHVGMNANGGTLGKRMLGMRVRNKDTGENIGYGAAFVRYLVAIVSGLALLLGYLWCIWDERKQTWHDKAVGSVVVMT